MTDSILNRPDARELLEWLEKNASSDPVESRTNSGSLLQSEESSPLSRPRILVADDDPRIRTALRRRLEFAGYEVLTACDGGEALRIARGDSPDLIVLDVSMPGCTGFRVAKTLRDDPSVRSMPIIFMTGVEDPGYFDEAIHHQGVAFLGKPFDSATLLPLVESALEYDGLWR